MKRKFAVGLLVALVLVLGITVVAMAAGPGPNNEAAVGYAGQGAALYGTFVDGDGDGICDNYAVRVPSQDGSGARWGAGDQAGYGTPGVNFVDEDGDGVCDNCLGDGTQPHNGMGMQGRQGGRWHQ